MLEKIIDGVWKIEETTSLDKLVINEGASIEAPEGKGVILMVNGRNEAAVPGTYRGDVKVLVHDYYMMPPSGLQRLFGGPDTPFRNALVITDGHICPARSFIEMINGGEITNTYISGAEIYSCENDVNGILIDGDSTYEIRDCRIEFEGSGSNDFIGVGAGITAIGNSKVTIQDSDLQFSGVTRCCFHAGGETDLTINNSRIINNSPKATDNPRLLGSPNWLMGIYGTNRSNQVCENAVVHINDSYMKSNGWGVISVDGSIKNRVYLRNTTLDLTGPRARGYGVFCIGDCYFGFDSCDVTVNGFAMLLDSEPEKRGMDHSESGGIFSNCVVRGNLFAVMAFRDRYGTVTFDRGTVVNTDSSTICVKGSTSIFNFDNVELNPGNGVIMQLMDNDDPGMGGGDFYKIPYDETDVYAGRDLVNPDPTMDIFVNLSNMDVCGDFLNSTTELKANDRHPPMEIPEGIDPEDWEDMGEGLQGAHNLVIDMKNVRAESVMSAAKQWYDEEGTDTIDAESYYLISCVKQEPAPTVNNGVIVTMDGNSEWTVTGTSYITSLTVAEGAVVKAPEGKTLVMTVDGKETPVAAGKYTGTIVLDIK
jgi:hypothetical protein